MSDGPKRFSLSDYQSKRGAARPAESHVSGEQRNELEELHMLLGTGFGSGDGALDDDDMDDGTENDILRTPGASPKNGYGEFEDLDKNGEEGEEGEDMEVDTRSDDRNGRRSDKKSSRSSRRRRRRGSRRSRSPRSRSRTPSRSRRSRGHSSSRSRSPSADSDSHSRSHRSSRRRRREEPDRSRSRDRVVSVRAVFPYEDGGIIIGLRGAHLTKLRRATQQVEWKISSETNDKQDRILVVKGSVRKVAEAFRELAEHFISQGMHVDYPPQMRGRGIKEVDTDKPFVPIRLLIPHKTCGAIIGQKSETLINTRVNCAARRVYVYRERISESRERVVEIVGTPSSVERVIQVIGNQVRRTLTSDQQESQPYKPERDGLRKFLAKQGVPRNRVSLEPIKTDERSSRRRRSRSSRSPSSSASSRSSSNDSRSRSRHRHRSRRHRRRSHTRSKSRRSRHRSRRSSRRSKRTSRSRSESRSASRSESESRSRSRRRSSRHRGLRKSEDARKRNGSVTGRSRPIKQDSEGSGKAENGARRLSNADGEVSAGEVSSPGGASGWGESDRQDDVEPGEKNGNTGDDWASERSGFADGGSW